MYGWPYKYVLGRENHSPRIQPFFSISTLVLVCPRWAKGLLTDVPAGLV